MYERFYGFRERPFTLTPDPRFIVLTEAHREAITNIEYGIAGRHGITLLIGAAGSGKTTVIRYAIERQPGTVHCVHLSNPALTRAHIPRRQHCCSSSKACFVRVTTPTRRPC